MLKKLFVEMDCVDARMKVKADLNRLSLNFTPQILKELKDITNLFINEDISQKRKEKKEILGRSEQQGFIDVSRQNNLFAFYMCLHGEELLLYEDPKDERPPKYKLSLKEVQIDFLPQRGQILVKHGPRGRSRLVVQEKDGGLYAAWREKLVK